ncbi:MAG: glycoside hydrolase family 2 protein, partial [Candidatus Symbiothrix sp.]|nr:glycoside hydrolase family 2 protein [Candidatus Symbiothrix sp.]
ANEGFVSVTFTDKGGEIYTNRYFLSLQKDIPFPAVKISRNIQAISGGYEISLQPDRFARAVFLSMDGIDHFFEDNYFDLLPGKEVKVKVSTALSRKEFEKQLKIRSYNR